MGRVRGPVVSPAVLALAVMSAGVAVGLICSFLLFSPGRVFQVMCGWLKALVG
jgi:hypothetical protein